MANGMKITVTSDDTNRHARAVFTWTEDGLDCDVVSFGFSDVELDAILEVKGHEIPTVQPATVGIS